MSSTTEGYLILPKLRDSTYNFSIGFSGTQNEHRFSININKADRGFIIKRANEAVSLFDLQTLRNYNAIQATVSSAPTQLRNDSFTKLLSQASRDTSLLVESLTIKDVKKEQPKTAVVEVAKSTGTPRRDSISQPLATISEPAIQTPAQGSPGETAAVAIEEPVQEKRTVDTTVAITSPIVDSKIDVASEPGQEFRRSVVLRHAESSTSEGFGLVFLDVTEGIIDTVRIVIPNPPIVVAEPVPQAPANLDRKFLELPDSSGSRPVLASAAKTEAAKPVVRCATLATDDDFFKIRRDMAAKKVEEDMIAQAKKHFKSRCFKTEHIKYLSVLFLTDAGKYKFFDAAHTHVSDVQKFEGLQAEMSDPYYINRFKALVGR